MRQGQQKHRGRNRPRKPQNPLARNYESSGPDVKIRGTASHVAEKYASLARDALSSGDLVMAESYLQHAEHYNRIIMAAQAQQSDSQPGQPRSQRFDRDNNSNHDGSDSMSPGDMDDSGSDEDAGEAVSSRGGENAGSRGPRPRRQRQRYQNGNGGARGHDQADAEGENKPRRRQQVPGDEPQPEIRFDPSADKDGAAA